MADNDMPERAYFYRRELRPEDPGATEYVRPDKCGPTLQMDLIEQANEYISTERTCEEWSDLVGSLVGELQAARLTTRERTGDLKTVAVKGGDAGAEPHDRAGLDVTPSASQDGGDAYRALIDEARTHQAHEGRCSPQEELLWELADALESMASKLEAERVRADKCGPTREQVRERV